MAIWALMAAMALAAAAAPQTEDGGAAAALSVQDRIDRQRANRIYDQQRERDRLERERVDRANADNQAAYQDALRRRQELIDRQRADHQERVRRCLAGDYAFCAQPGG